MTNTTSTSLALKKKKINRIFPEEVMSLTGKLSKGNRVEQFAEWFYKEGQDKVLTHQACGISLEKILAKTITLGALRSYISNARVYLEAKKAVTIWNIPGEGWRIASEKQKAVHLIRAARLTIRHGERAVRLYDITDKKEIPDAIITVFGDKAKAQEQLLEYNDKFQLLFKGGLLKKAIT